MSRGGPSKFTNKLKAQIVESLRLGLSQQDVLTLYSITLTGLRDAQKRDPEFLRGVSTAKMFGKQELLRRIKDGEDKDRGARWLLERQYGAEYGRQLNITHAGGIALEPVLEIIASAETRARQEHQTSTNGEAAHTAPPGAGRLP